MPRQPSPGHFHQLLRGDPQPLPSQARDVISLPSPGREASGRHPSQMPEPPQLTPFDVEKQQFYSELLPDIRASHPISKAEPSHPAEETHFSRLYPRSRSFGHHPTLMAIDPEILELLHLGQDLLSDPQKALYLFRARTMDSNLEVLSRIPAASHSVANRPRICWRSLLDGTRTTASSAKSSDEIIRPPNWTPSTPWLHLEILSIKVMNRTGDKGQPWRSSTLTGNKYDLQPAIRTKLVLLWYRDWTVLIKGPFIPYSRSTPTQDAPGDPVISLFQVHKAHVDWLGKLPTPLKYPSMGKELIRGSTTGAKPALFLLDQRFDDQSNPLFEHPGIDFPREAEKCDPSVVGTHPLVPTLKNRDHHPGLPVQGHFPQFPHKVAEVCQLGQPYNIHP
ncbi:hypothetical protein D4764_02G0002640 [Takifugu flavidus]|uniref:Uncharacterized protein n=1 Tax=Takifugu flavidus TaxID=433684 RepID=A0A5C6NJ21_9TELE|nr:hypothetical protein D4764_02G0002640 [Takifugu flavidus]